jgi:hypothetical protein
MRIVAWDRNAPRRSTRKSSWTLVSIGLLVVMTAVAIALHLAGFWGSSQMAVALFLIIGAAFPPSVMHALRDTLTSRRDPR